MTLFNRAGAVSPVSRSSFAPGSSAPGRCRWRSLSRWGMSAQRLAKIGEALKKESADGSFRGAVVMVARKGKLVYQDAGRHADGLREDDAGGDLPHLFDDQAPGSVAAMMLVEDGVVQLTDP